MVDVKIEAMSDDRHTRHQDSIAYAPPIESLPSFRHQPFGYQYAPPQTGAAPLSVKTVMSLPSFATLDSGSREDMPRSLPSASHDSPRQPLPESRSMYGIERSASTCTCPQMKPLIAAAGELVRKLNDSAQRRVLDTEYEEFLKPITASLQSMQWIVDQLTSIEASLRSGRDSVLERRFIDVSSGYKRGAPNEPGLPLDRPLTPSKRQRTGSESASNTRRQSPTYQRQTSPGTYRRESQPDLRQHLPPSGPGSRLLPSPSSSTILPYPPSGHHSHKAPSMSPPPASSTSGPSMRSHPSHHSHSVHSATAEHVAELQHQITLKSMAVNTLQNDQQHLLQKMHRESVKFQAIEKKSKVAEQEINDLLTKNEDLADQTKDLTAQVTDLEKRREDEKQAVTREKEQWGRMLDMSGRLQRKAEEDKRKLQDENARLAEVIEWYEQEEGKHGPRPGSDADSTRPRPHPSLTGRLATQASPSIDLYKSQIELLRTTLEDVRQQNIQASEKARELQTARDELIAAVDIVLNKHNSESAQQGASV